MPSFQYYRIGPCWLPTWVTTTILVLTIGIAAILLLAHVSLEFPILLFVTAFVVFVFWALVRDTKTTTPDPMPFIDQC